MNTEIELKFLVTPAFIGRLPSLLADHEIRVHDQTSLANTYFDTATLSLSKLKAGLRIRRQNDHLEQTLKLAGSQVGGLHQRPEYNVNITESPPDLSLFPAHIWPSDFPLAQVQADLQPLFSTDFVRQRWIIQLDHTELELALDVGEVRAGEASSAPLSEPIQELELELSSGEVGGLFSLAEQLLKYGGMRLSAVSKAQRGYRLAGLAPAPRRQSLDINAYGELSQLERLGQGLAHWQHHEQGVLDNQTDKAAWLEELRLGLGWVEQSLSALNAAVEDLTLTGWLNELAWLRIQLQAAPVANDLFYSARYGRLVLQLTRYLYIHRRH